MRAKVKVKEQKMIMNKNVQGAKVQLRNGELQNEDKKKKKCCIFFIGLLSSN